MQFDVWTLILQVVNFLILIWILHRFLYKPVQAMIARRQQAIADDYAKAETKEREAVDAREQVERDRAELDRQRQTILDDAHRQAEQIRQEQLAKARAEIDELRDGAEDALAKEREAALQDMTQWAADTAIEMARRLLSDGTGAADAERFLDQAWDKLASLDDAERDELHTQLGAANRIEVATAPALPADAVERWRTKLTEWAGGPVEVAFAADDTLIAGAELRFPHTVISYCWRDTLADARKELESGDEPA